MAFPFKRCIAPAFGCFKNEQGAPHRLPGVMISEQGFLGLSGRARIKKLAQDYRVRLATWNIGTLSGKTGTS